MAVYTNINRNNKNNRGNNRPTRSFLGKRIGYALITVASICYVALFTHFLGFLRTFLMGMFGIFSYALFSSLFIIARALMKGKKFNLNKKYVLLLSTWLISFLSVLQMAFLSASTSLGFGAYLSYIYNLQTSIGGLIIGLFTFPFIKFLNPVGAFVIFIIILGVMSALIIDHLELAKTFKRLNMRTLTNYNELEKNTQEENFEHVNEKELKRIKNKEPLNLASNEQVKASVKQEAMQRLGLSDTRNQSFEAEASLEETMNSYQAGSQFEPMFQEPQAKSRRPERIVHNSYNDGGAKKTKKQTHDAAKKRNLEFLRATLPAKPVKTNKIMGVGIQNPNQEFSTGRLNNRINNRLNNINPVNNTREKTVSEPIKSHQINNEFEKDLKKLEQLNGASKSAGFDTNPIIPNLNRTEGRDLFTRRRPEIKTIEAVSSAPKSPISSTEQMEIATRKVKKQKPKKAKYFDEGMKLRLSSQKFVEKLDDNRLKIPISMRWNYYLNDFMRVRTFYRYYTDSWGITAHTASIELPMQITPSLIASPFFRYHTQTAADDFYEFGQASNSQQPEFYTSDYDLSDLNSTKIGLGLQYSPVMGVGSFKSPFRKGKQAQFKSIGLRTAYYDRSDGLSAWLVSLDFAFTF